MSEPLPELHPEALDALAVLVGDRYTGTEITALFRKSGFPQFVHDGSTKWRFVAEVFAQLQREAKGNPAPVLKVVQTMCGPLGYIRQRERFEELLRAVNEVLEFSGLLINSEGMLQRSNQATTVRATRGEDERAFDSRGFHPQVVLHGRRHFSRGAYFHAVFECCKAFDGAVRANSGIGKSGQPLMSEALSLTGPVKLNAQVKSSERDEQQGAMYLCMGLMNAVRNPQAHEPELHWPMNREDALDVLGLISFLYRKLENAIVVLPGSPPVRVQL